MARTKNPKPNSGSIKPGETRNPHGRPKDENSWAGVIRMLRDMTADEIAEMVGGKSTDLGRAFLQMPQKIQMKYLISMRAMAQLMFESNGSLWEKIMERDDGKVKEQLDLTSDGKALEVRIIKASDARTDNQ